ncbi:MAG: N-acetylmuramoyl-L-alanine amidase [Pseudomonadota bacterium]
MQIINHPSPNAGPRIQAGPPFMLVYHATWMADVETSIRRLCDPKSQVSCHYVIGRCGTVWQLVDPKLRAWHAGRSWWRGILDVNSAAIGIEIQAAHPGDGIETFTDAQIQHLLLLVDNLTRRYSIADWGHVAHHDIAPQRKQDPGPYFPWALLAAHGFGWWPERSSSPFLENINDHGKDGMERDLGTVLDQLGYDPSALLDARICAFHARFRPQHMHRPADEISYRLALNCLRAWGPFS